MFIQLFFSYFWWPFKIISLILGPVNHLVGAHKQNLVSQARLKSTGVIFCLFDLLLFVHGKKLRTCHYGHLVENYIGMVIYIPHCAWAGLLVAVYVKYFLPILLPVTDN